MKNCCNRANKGQFSIIAALLVSVILVSAVISIYTTVRHSEVPESSNVLSVVGEMNSDIKSILDFTVGYYGSILQVTGNSTYAKNLTTSYLSSGLVNIARSHPDWNPTFTLDLDGEYADVSTRWFMPDSYSKGSVDVTYSIGSLGIYDVSFYTSSALNVAMLEAPIGFANVSVTRDNSEPELGLGKENFSFFKYTADSTWELVNPPEVVISDGFYIITLPSGVDPVSYSIQVEDNRGLVVSAFYSQESVVSASRIPHVTYYFDWESTGVLDIYNSLDSDVFALELLQNGTIKWLGQPLQLNPDARPIPPVSIKAFRVNATIAGNTHEIPFQIEDWASDYMVPLGLAGNDSIFNNNNMLVFLANNTIEEITLWWDGNDTAIQTSYAWENIYFNDDKVAGTLYNGFLDLRINNFWIESSVRSNPSVDCTANFARVNYPDDDLPQYGDQLSYVIYNGIVRDIIQQEPEYGDGVDDCPNFYSQVFLTLPAKAPYYTYSVRTVFLESVDHPRTITDLSAIQLSDLSGNPLTEDGHTEDGYPETSDSSDEYFDGYPSDWNHHWSQFISGDSGAGIMFTDIANSNLYLFDGITGTETGALVVDYADNLIEFNPVEYEVNTVNGHTDSLDAVWYGAVVTFDGEPIYTSPADDHLGLWVMVEYPPAVTMDEFNSEINYVDITSNIASSADKGTHSDFNAQKSGPDMVLDILTEKNTGGTVTATLIDAESFEDTWPPTSWTDTFYWRQSSGQQYHGTYSAWFDGDGGRTGTLTTLDMDCSDAESIVVDFWYRDRGCEDGEFVLQYYDGSNWNFASDLGLTDTHNTWLHYHDKISNSQYFDSDFKIRWVMSASYYDDDAYVDLVTVTKEASGPDNYEIDLEARWTNADFEESNEELCIYVGETSGEDLEVQVWDGSWHTVDTLSVGWNNVTVSSYLTSENFVIRFVGADEIGDTTQDYWTIDATLLHTWS